MTEKVSLYQAVKDNWAQITVLTVVLGVIGGIYMEWRIESIVGKMDLGTDEKIINMDKATATNTTGVAENKEDITLTQTQLIEVARVLMRPPGE